MDLLIRLTEWRLVLSVGLMTTRQEFKLRTMAFGFSADTLMQLNNKFAMIREQIRSRGKVTELEIGGLGLANTYARLIFVLWGSV
jgi:hypothetical protein